MGASVCVCTWVPEIELALQVLESSLEVHRTDHVTLAPLPADSNSYLEFIDRECTRRCFWLIHIMALINNICTRKPIWPRMAELADLIRLPTNETTFESAILWSSVSECPSLLLLLNCGYLFWATSLHACLC